MIEKFTSWIKSVFQQLIGINDTPHRKAGGLALGVFLGIFPGVGPLAALALSWLLRLNKAAALLGSVLTNTWFTVVTFALATQVGAFLVGKDKESLRQSWQHILKDFHWQKFFSPELREVVYPVALGFVVVSFGFAVVVYVLAYGFFTIQNKKRNI